VRHNPCSRSFCRRCPSQILADLIPIEFPSDFGGVCQIDRPHKKGATNRIKKNATTSRPPHDHLTTTSRPPHDHLTTTSRRFAICLMQCVGFLFKRICKRASSATFVYASFAKSVAKPTSRPPHDHLATTSRPPHDHPRTTSGPPLVTCPHRDHLATNSRPTCDHLATTSRPPCDHLATTSRPPQTHFHLRPKASKWLRGLPFCDRVPLVGLLVVRAL
jgi:hypothetical protein